MTSSFEVTTIGGKKRKTEDEQIYTIFVSREKRLHLTRIWFRVGKLYLAKLIWSIFYQEKSDTKLKKIKKTVKNPKKPKTSFPNYIEA